MTNIKINDLPKLKNAEKANNYGDFQFYSKKYQNKTKDLSPDGVEQNLLLVFCPENTKDFCQFQILIFSDLDEIVLEKNDIFYGVSQKSDNFNFKLTIKQYDNNFKYCDFCINVTNDDINFDTLDDFNNATITEIKKENKKCYRYQVDKGFNDINKNDIEIIFNIKANKDINFVLTNEVFSIYEIDQIINLNNFIFPYELNIKLDNASNYNTDLLLNIYLSDKYNQDMNIILDNIQIGVIIVNQSLLDELEGKNNKEIFNNNNSLIGKLDKGTRSAVLNINKEFITKQIKDKSQSWYLYLLFYENNLKNIINQEFLSKIFVLRKENTSPYFLDQNTYLTDEINIDNNDIINLYHLNIEQNDILELKFSSNYPLNDKFFLYFLSYDKNAIIDLDYCKKNALTYEQNQNGEMYTLILRQLSKNNINEITFVVVSQIKKGEIGLNKINYLFKYNSYENSEYNDQLKYDFNETYDIIEKNDKIIFSFNAIKKKSEINYPKSEVYIRKINKNKAILNESFDTFAKIESEYDLIKGVKTEENGKINMAINKNDYTDGVKYSIILDIFEENEKFVISKKKGKDDKNEGYNNKTIGLLLKILISVGVVVVVIIIVLTIVFIKKFREGGLKDKIMQTSFQEEGALIKDNNEEIIDENILT